MVALRGGAQGELERLIEEQRRDARGRGSRPRREVLATDARIDLDRLPRRRPEGLPLIEGRPCEWAAKDEPGSPCPVCNGRPGTSRCLKCTASAYDATHEYAGVISPVGGPTVYAGTGGLKGGVGA